MKNLFFALAFMLVGTFAFANTKIEVPTESTNLENVINLDETLLDSEAVCGFTLSWDTDNGSGSTYISCEDIDPDTFWEDLMDLFNWL